MDESIKKGSFSSPELVGPSGRSGSVERSNSSERVRESSEDNDEEYVYRARKDRRRRQTKYPFRGERHSMGPVEVHTSVSGSMVKKTYAVVGFRGRLKKAADEEGDGKVGRRIRRTSSSHDIRDNVLREMEGDSGLRSKSSVEHLSRTPPTKFEKEREMEKEERKKEGVKQEEMRKEVRKEGVKKTQLRRSTSLQWHARKSSPNLDSHRRVSTT